MENSFFNTSKDTSFIKKIQIKQFVEEQMPYTIFPKIHVLHKSENQSDVDKQMLFSGGRYGEFYPVEIPKTAERLIEWCKKKKLVISEKDSLITRRIKDIVINSEQIIFEFNNNKSITWDEKKGKFLYFDGKKRPTTIKEIYFTD